MAERPLSHPRYRADIDGLRAIAILSVVAFHAFPTWVRGGFIGVDIFFVISGFLISTIVLGNLRADSFSYKLFYARRIKRIFPALLLVLGATWLFGWAVLLPDEYRQLGAHLAGGAGFVANFVLWGERGYFDTAADSKPLLHLWSLGIEEQFYLAWPLLLVLVSRWRRAVPFAIALTASVSFTVSLIAAHGDTTAAFYSPLSRAWELMIGGVLAYLTLHRPGSGARASNWLSAAGFCLIAGALVTITSDKAFPGWWALLPTLGVFLVILAGPTAWLNARVLANRALVWVGLISYPLYLWHWPLLSYGHIISGGLPTRTTRLLLIATAIALASLTYTLVERPFKRIDTWNRAVTSLLALVCAFVAIGFAVRVGLQAPRLQDTGVGAYTEAMGDWEFPSRGFKTRRVGLSIVHEIRTPNSGTTLFAGDSLVEQYGPRIDSVIGRNPARYNTVVFATAGGCPPVPGVYRLPRHTFYPCESMRETAFELARSAEVTNVVLGTNWFGLFDAADNDGRLVFARGGTSIDFSKAEAREMAYASLEGLVAELSREKRVFLLLPPPVGPSFDPRNMFEGSRFRRLFPVRNIAPVALSSWLATGSRVRERLTALAYGSGAAVIDPTERLCRNSECPVLDAEGRPLYKDGLHMRPSYVRTSAGFIDQTIAPPEGRSASDTRRRQEAVETPDVLDHAP